QEEFESIRDYLSKNVYLMTATQDQRLGYALDSWWYGIPEYTDYMRAQYAKLTRDDVNNALKKYQRAKSPRRDRDERRAGTRRSAHKGRVLADQVRRSEARGHRGRGQDHRCVQA